MKKSIIILLGVVVALCGCKRSEMPGEAPVSGHRLVAEAGLGEGVKSHFDTDGYNLVWDSTDKLLVYSNYMGSWENYQALINQIQTEYASESVDEDNAGIIAYFRLLRDNADKRYAGTFSISSGAGQATAEFISDGLASTWMAEGTDEELYYFLPFYPAPAVAPEINSYCFDEVQGSQMAAEAPFPYCNMTIQTEQDGVNYQNYQLLMGGIDGPSVKGELLSGEKIPFNDFMPLTSILEFTMQTSSGSGEIDHMDITLSTQEEVGAGYVSNKYMIAGTVPLFFSWDEANEMRFWNRACKPFMSGFGSNWNDYHHDFEATGWEGLGSDATSTLRLQFESPVSVNADDPTTQKYYAVMIPSRCIHKSDCGNPRLTFDAYDALGNKIFTKTIETTSTQGIEEGTKYPFDLVLDKVASLEDNIVQGAFSVSASRQVNFSRGNLFLNHPSFVSGQRWGFAPFQYMSGVYYGRRNDTYEDSWFTSSQMIDLFGWATAGVKNPAGEYGAAATHTSYQPWAHSDDNYSYGPEIAEFGGSSSWSGTSLEAYCEWGRNPEFVAIYGAGWRTLSYAEWHYLLFDRAASPVNGVSNARFCKGTYQGYEGLFVFSDTFGSDTPNPFLSYFAGAPINQGDAGFDSVEIMFSENENYSSRYYGLVFLPVNALREGNELGYDSYGAYWSSTPLDDGDAYAMAFDPDNVMKPKDCELGRCCGLSVRLVKDIDETGPSLGASVGNAGQYKEDKEW